MNDYQNELKKTLERIEGTCSEDWELLFSAPWKSLHKTRTLAKVGISRLTLRGTVFNPVSATKTFRILSEGALPTEFISVCSFENKDEFLFWLKDWIRTFLGESEDMEGLGFDQGSFTGYEYCFGGRSLKAGRTTYAGSPVVEVDLCLYSMKMKNAVLKHIKDRFSLSDKMELPAFLRDMAVQYQNFLPSQAI